MNIRNYTHKVSLNLVIFLNYSLKERLFAFKEFFYVAFHNLKKYILQGKILRDVLAKWSVGEHKSSVTCKLPNWVGVWIFRPRLVELGLNSCFSIFKIVKNYFVNNLMVNKLIYTQLATYFRLSKTRTSNLKLLSFFNILYIQGHLNPSIFFESRL